MATRNPTSDMSATGGFGFSVFGDDEIEKVHLATLEVVEKFLGDVGTLGSSAGATSPTQLGFDKLFAIDVDEVASASTDVVAGVDPQAVAVAFLQGRYLEGSVHEQNFFFKQGVHLGRAVAVRTGADTTVVTFRDRAIRNLAVVVSERALGLFPICFGGVEIRGVPVFHALGQGHFSVA